MVFRFTVSPQIPSGSSRRLAHTAKLQLDILHSSSAHLHQTLSPRYIVAFFPHRNNLQLWKQFFAEGTLKFEGTYIEGFADGKHKHNYPNGMTKQIAFYAMGNKDKKWKNYDKEGNLVTIIEYKGGKKYKIDGQKIKDK